MVKIEFNANTTRQEAETLIKDLTPKEKEVLRLIAEGSSRAEVARQMQMSSKTYDSHLYHIRIKTGVRAVSRLARLWILARGL
jgi:two-component system nitrate/nitrite response regulator NarL